MQAIRHGQLGVLLDHPLDVLDDDDGIIDHDADGQHQRQQRDGIGRVADEPASTAKVPTIDTGTATSGISVVRQLPEEQEHHHGDKYDGYTSVRTTSVDRRGDENRGVEENGVREIGGKARRQLRSWCRDLDAPRPTALDPGDLIDAERGRRQRR